MVSEQMSIDATQPTDEKRPYRKRRRAELEAQTRERIVESAVALHGTLGPSRTSLSAIAEHAGVTRSTLYRHFADEAAVFDACSAHWSEHNPVPDPGAWAKVADPGERTVLALTELYAFYARNAQMLENLYRDAATMPVVAQRFGAFGAYFEAAADALMAGRTERGRARTRVRAAVAHGLSFSTWRSLTVDHGLGAADAVALMARLAAVAGA
jgi:AcrR family transcriptional regulator